MPKREPRVLRRLPDGLPEEYRLHGNEAYIYVGDVMIHINPRGDGVVEITAFDTNENPLGELEVEP